MRLNILDSRAQHKKDTSQFVYQSEAKLQNSIHENQNSETLIALVYDYPEFNILKTTAHRIYFMDNFLFTEHYQNIIMPKQQSPLRDVISQRPYSNIVIDVA